MNGFHYVGSELELFARALNWKRYWVSQIDPYVSGDVLEVGAGLGSNVTLLSARADRLVCLEPDPSLAHHLSDKLASEATSTPTEVHVGTLHELPADELFDTILYIDVLEHIGDDRRELEHATSHLRMGGRLIVLGPAHQWLYSPFDESIGHFRRYDARSLRASAPAELEVVSVRYLDSAGLLSSAANRFILRRSVPTKRQIAFWDKMLIPISRFLDPLAAFRVGKSVLVIWIRQ